MDTKNFENKKVEKVKSLIGSIDLDMVKKKLMDRRLEYGWTQTYCNEIEELYREFLCMVYFFPEKPIVPTKEIDMFWHNHILDTRAYAEDCQKVFGKFIHHYPYSGMKDEADARRQDENFEETKRIYHDLFGKIYDSIAAKCRQCSIWG